MNGSALPLVGRQYGLVNECLTTSAWAGLANSLERYAAVVGDQPLDRCPRGRVVHHARFEELRGRGLALVRMHLHERSARGTVDGHMRRFPAALSIESRQSQAHASSTCGSCQAHLGDPLDQQKPDLPSRSGILMTVHAVDPFRES